MSTYNKDIIIIIIITVYADYYLCLPTIVPVKCLLLCCLKHSIIWRVAISVLCQECLLLLSYSW